MDSDGHPEYSLSVFSIMLIIGIIGLLGYVFVAAGTIGGM